MPVEDRGASAFEGQEYLGLYKSLEKVRVNGVIRPYVVGPARRQAESLGSFSAGQGQFVELVTS